MLTTGDIALCFIHNVNFFKESDCMDVYKQIYFIHLDTLHVVCHCEIEGGGEERVCVCDCV
jgi:hypothetical protein